MNEHRGEYPDEWGQRALEVKCRERWRCVRCGHPGAVEIAWHLVYQCSDMGRIRSVPEIAGRVAEVVADQQGWPAEYDRALRRCRTLYADPGDPTRAWLVPLRTPCGESCSHAQEGKRRQLTVHHLDGDKANLRWWNLAALCQVCHLQVQAKVQMERTYLWPHSEWMRPYVAGYYAWAVLGEELGRPEVEERLEELLAAGQPHLYQEGGAGGECFT